MPAGSTAVGAVVTPAPPVVVPAGDGDGRATRVDVASGAADAADSRPLPAADGTTAAGAEVTTTGAATPAVAYVRASVGAGVGGCGRSSEEKTTCQEAVGEGAEGSTPSRAVPSARPALREGINAETSARNAGTGIEA